MENIIEVENLSKKFKENVAVDDISFQVKKGEIFGFLGPNGAGKTTTIRMLTGQLLPSGGAIQVCGIDPTKEEKKLAMKIGVVPEIQNLYSDLNAEQNLKLFADLYSIDHKRVKELLEMFKLTDMKEPVKKLSKGLKQRVLIARALIHNPELLFLDEPTIGLDPNIAKEIRKIIKILKEEGKTVFLTTHYMEEADALCDRVAIINEGKIIALDSPHELRLKYGKREFIVETDSEIKRYSFENIKALSSLNPKKIRSIHSTEPTLEDVFIALTGRRIEK
ncbi:ABC transporter ATP-binding protein [Thermococci archaeon]|nr:MAG: ABC transporter ATP-binding protein [Thermococci archaeon]